MMDASTRLVMARRIPIRIWLLRLGVLPPARLTRWGPAFTDASRSRPSQAPCPNGETTLEIGQKRCRSAFTFSRSASLASVVTSTKRPIFGNGTSISSSNLCCGGRESTRRRSCRSSWLELDAMLLRAFVTGDVGGRRRAAHVRAFTLLGFVDDYPDVVAYGNFRTRMGRAVTMNTLRRWSPFSQQP